MRDVCRISGLSKATVSRVLNNHPHVDSATRSRILDVIATLGYTPSAAARNLSRRRTDLIGLVLPDISTGFYSQVIQGADAMARAHRHNLLVAFAHEENGGFEASLGLLKDRRIDGLISLQPLADDTVPQRLARIGRPVVLLQKPPAGSGLCHVAMDDFEGGRCVASHLLESGCRRLLVVAGPEVSRDSCERLRGARSAWTGEELEIIHTDFTPADAVKKLLARWNWAIKPDAIFALNDDMALGIWKALEARGVRIPTDVCLAGFDGVAAAAFGGLTSYETPLDEMGRRAAELLIRLIDGRAPSSRAVILTGRLAVRRSSSPCLSP